MIVRCVQRNGFRARLWRFAWDEFDRLREVLTPEGERWRYRYDAFGRRISKQCEGACRHRPRRIDYLWQGSRLVEEWCSYEREVGDTRARNEIRRWHYGPGSHAVLAQERLCYEREPSLPESEWYPLACDPNGAPHTMYNSEGRAVWRARSSLWGETARDTTSVRMREMLRHVVHDPYLATCLTAGDETLECELRFAGQWADEESGLHYNCQRYYDPQTGQYLSGDPIGLEGGLNVYRYAPNPLGWIDPWGLSCWTSTSSKSSAENAYGHWKKHGAEFPEFQNAKQYVEGTKSFVSGPPSGTLTKIRPNGEVVFYDPGSNTFAVTTSNGTPKTMFRPDPAQHGFPSNLDYYNAQ
ncbi:RHS domain-containing protein [Paraburkholderia xenovorans]